jgi:hypothetical protein
MPMKHFMVLWALAAMGASAGRGQVPDTLDPGGYFALAVGNTWEYVHSLYRPGSLHRPEDQSETRLEQYRIVGSHSIQDTTFFDLLLRVQTEQGAPLATDTFRIWFDTGAAGVRGEAPQIVSWLQCLDAPYGTSDRVGQACWPFVSREEAYEAELFGVQEPVPAKQFASYVWSFRVVHGIGLINGGGGCEPCSARDDTDHWKLKYARVGSRPYGVRVVGTEPPVVQRESRLEAYPNPTSGYLTLAVGGVAHVEITDLLGRRMQVVDVGAAGKTTIDVEGYAPGVYFARAGMQVRLFIVE